MCSTGEGVGSEHIATEGRAASKSNIRESTIYNERIYLEVLTWSAVGWRWLGNITSWKVSLMLAGTVEDRSRGGQSRDTCT